VTVAVEVGQRDERRARSDRALARALGRAAIERDQDGRPRVAGAHLSVSHAASLTLAAAGDQPIGCDLEPVARGADDWRALVGPARYALAERLARALAEDEATSGTRVWTVHEAVRKAGAPDDVPLTLGAELGGGWVEIAAGPLSVVSWVTELDGLPAPLAVALATAARSTP
jgi:hypothetical protein